MSLLFKKRLKKFKSNSIKNINLFLSEKSLPSLYTKDYSFPKLNSNNKLLINQEENLVKSLNLDDIKTKIPFIQISNNTKVNIFNKKVEEKRKEKLKEWDIKDIFFNANNKINSNLDFEKAKEFKQKIYLEKITSLEKEKNLVEKLKESENKLKNLKEKRDIIYKKIEDYTNKLNKCSYEMDDLKSENNITQRMILNLIKRRQTKVSSSEKSIELINNLDKFKSQKREYDIYQEKKNLLLNNIIDCNSNIIQLNKKQNENKILITQIQEEYKKLKKELLDYYHQILLEGVDTRKYGLSWVIEEIWNLGEEVNMNFIPDFLDVKGINFLFSITKKYNLLQKVKIQIEKFKKDSCKNLNIRKNNKINIKTNKNIFSTGLGNIEKEGPDNINMKILEYNNPSLIKIRDYIKMKKKSEIFRNSKYTNKSMSFPKPFINNKSNKKINLKIFLSNSNISNENNKIDEDSLTSRKTECFDKFQKLKFWEKYIEKDIEMEKNSELKRIWNEFTRNDYEKKFNIDIRIVISSLVGENNMIKEIEKQKNISNELKKIQKICSFYDTFENGKINNSQKININKIKLINIS